MTLEEMVQQLTCGTQGSEETGFEGNKKGCTTVLCNADQQHCQGGRILLGIQLPGTDSALPEPGCRGPCSFLWCHSTELLTCPAFPLPPKAHHTSEDPNTLCKLNLKQRAELQ